MSARLPVPSSPELLRIAALPRRLKPSAEAGRELTRAWSYALLNAEGRALLTQIERLPPAEQVAALDWYATHPDGPRCPLMLRVIQAQALSEAAAVGGLFASAAVGAGKTLIALLLPRVMGATRPVLFVPSGLAKQAADDFARLSRFWESTPPFIINYETIGHPDHAKDLCGCIPCTQALEATSDGYRPDLVICDECDLLRDPKSGRTIRIRRYITNHLAAVRACFMTGTPLRKSLRNMIPLILLALRDRAPVPMSWLAIEQICCALDDTGRGPTMLPGAIFDLAACSTQVSSYDYEGNEDPHGYILARDIFRARLLQTCGVIASTEQSCDKPLAVRLIAPPEDRVGDAFFHHFRKTQTTPDKWDVDDPLSAFRYGTELGCDFYSMWDPRPPEPWLEARREASVFIRETIAASQRRGRAPLDTTAQVYRAYPKAEPLLAWKEVEPTFRPNSVAVPISANVLSFAAKWLEANTPALVWVQHTYVGETLSKMTGVPYFAGAGKDKCGRYIGDHDASQSAILSIAANSRGRNLQAWNRGLVIGPPQAATAWEQGVFGRMHRQGQRRPVYLDVLLTCAENVRAVEKAYAEAEWCEQVAGQTQKLLIASYDWTSFPAERLALDVEHPSRARWASH